MKNWPRNQPINRKSMYTFLSFCFLLKASKFVHNLLRGKSGWKCHHLQTVEEINYYSLTPFQCHLSFIDNWEEEWCTRCSVWVLVPRVCPSAARVMMQEISAQLSIFVSDSYRYWGAQIVSWLFIFDKTSVLSHYVTSGPGGGCWWWHIYSIRHQRETRLVINIFQTQCH